MFRPPFRSLPFILFAATLMTAALPLPHACARDAVPPRSVSLSRQFVVYCPDAMARGQVASFAEETKRRLLALLGESDTWKYPVVINLALPGASNVSQPPSRVGLYETENGFKVELNVTLDADPRDARFQQQLVRALLLEYSYRTQPALVRSGVSYADPPAWLVEGATELFRNRDAGLDTTIFQTLINGGKLPSLAQFLNQDCAGLDTTSSQLFAACSLSLVQLLTDQPDGRLSLAAFVRHWPVAAPKGDSSGELIKHFPALGLSSQSLEKWWTLSMARLSAAQRHEGLTLEATHQRLAPILTFEIDTDKDGKTGEKRQFSIEQFEEYRKLPASRPALAAMSANLLALGTEANALLRPIVLEYQQAAADLSRGKTRGVKDRLATAALYREQLAHRLDEIADYLNWFEATQLTTKSGSFDEYIKTANMLALPKLSQRSDAITRYINGVEIQLE